MEEELKNTDLLYFGHETSSEDFEKDFMREVKEKFPNAKFNDAYNMIKGYRQELLLEESERDNYFSWLIGNDWHESSLNLQLIMMGSGTDEKFKAKFDKYLALAKTQYPEAFKPESLKK